MESSIVSLTISQKSKVRKNETQAMNDMVNKIQELQTILGNKVFVKKILDRIARGLNVNAENH